MPEEKKPQQSEFQKVRALMKEIGSPSGFDPIPPDQHRWMMDPDVPPFQRMWGWMIGHTMHWGHRSPFAISKEGHELHIEHAAKDLGLDVPNAYREWRKGIARGLWRNGQPEEGPRRMYLTGKVPRFKGESKIKELSVQTILPHAIILQIKDWEPERQVELCKLLESEQELERHVQAALAAANRAVFIQRQDNIFRQQGLEISRQVHQKKHEKPEDAEARRARIEPIRAPIENYVQTIRDFVQSSPPPPSQTAVSLSPAERKSREVPVGRTPLTAPRCAGNTPPVDREEVVKQLPAPQMAPPLSEGEKQAVELLYSEIRKMQEKPAFQHMEFTHETISPRRKSDQLFVYRVLEAIGPDYIEQFLRRVWVQLERLDRNALGKLPGKAPAPRSLGLILQWAYDYREKIAESVQMAEAEKAAWIARQTRTCYELLKAPDSDFQNPEQAAAVKADARKWLADQQLAKEQTA